MNKQFLIKIFILFITLLYYINLSGLNIITDINDSNRNYKDTLYKVANKIIERKAINEKNLLFCVPQTNTEAHIFFNLDYSKEKKYNYVYRELNKLWTQECIENPDIFLIKYFEFSMFTDGYFAEDYFINIQNIYNNSGEKICSYIQGCNQKKIKRLLLFFNENNICK